MGMSKKLTTLLNRRDELRREFDLAMTEVEDQYRNGDALIDELEPLDGKTFNAHSPEAALIARQLEAYAQHVNTLVKQTLVKPIELRKAILDVELEIAQTEHIEMTHDLFQHFAPSLRGDISRKLEGSLPKK
jgi:hypothetical protein